MGFYKGAKGGEAVSACEGLKDDGGEIGLRWENFTNLAKAFFPILIALLIINITVYKDYSSADSKKYVLVGLFYGSSSENRLEIEFKEGLHTAKFNDKDDIEIIKEYEDARYLIANYEDSTLEFSILDGERNELGNSNLAEVNLFLPLNYQNDGKFGIKNSVYRGGVLFNDLKNTMNVINYIEEEKYLYGVVGGEIGHRTGIEAQKAQAVASRSYTRVKGNTHASYGFDICSTPHCQLYKGFNGESESVRRAVDETYGETVKYEGKTVAAFYSKNSGGYTSSSEDVWGGKLGYLKAVCDEYSPDFPWKKLYTKQEIENRLIAGGKSIGSLEAIRIDERSKSGAVSKMTFVGNFGDVVWEKDKIRTGLGASSVKSLMFTFNGNLNRLDAGGGRGAGGSGDVVEEIYIFGKAGVEKVEVGETVQVVSADDGKSEIGSITLSGARVIGKSGVEKLEFAKEKQSERCNGEKNDRSSKAYSIADRIGGDDYVRASDEILFTGLGYGHGVGMAQDGAIEMAKKGFTYKEILKYYYTDVTIE